MTAMDVASINDAAEMRRLVLPSLPYIDYLIVNETEGGMLADIEARDENGALIPGAMGSDRKEVNDSRCQGGCSGSCTGGWLRRG